MWKCFLMLVTYLLTKMQTFITFTSVFLCRNNLTLISNCHIIKQILCSLCAVLCDLITAVTNVNKNGNPISSFITDYNAIHAPASVHYTQCGMLFSEKHGCYKDTYLATVH